MTNQSSRNWREEIQVAGKDLDKKVRELAQDATVHRIIVKKPDGSVWANLPIYALAPLLLPIAPLWFGTAALVGAGYLAKYKVEIVRRERSNGAAPRRRASVEDIEIEVEDESAAKAAPSIDELKSAEKEAEIVIGDTVDVVDATPEPAAPAAAPVAKVNTEPVDFTVIKGIGPKLNEALNSMGYSMATLAASDPVELKLALREAGVRTPALMTPIVDQAKELA